MSEIGTDRPGLPRGWAFVALAILVPATGGGCKMGTAGTKPSWWAFGGSTGTEADKLAAAPSFNGGIEKPSANAKPYPTTSTPNSYVLDDAAKAAGSAVAAVPPPAAVTYGATPPPTRPDPVALATSPAATPAPTVVPDTPAPPPLASITPQVGPYVGLPAEAAAAAAAPAPQRVADVRGTAAWPESPASGGRYDGQASSRFGSGANVDQSLSPPGTPALPAALDPLPPSATPAAQPSAFQPPPAATPPGLSPPPTAQPSAFPPPPAALPAPTVPGGPVRRPDPGYRPGGTSSYRPSRAILAGDPPAADPGGVRTVGFEAPVDAAP